MPTKKSSDKGQFKRWDQYVTEAAVPDFQLPVDDERTIHIKAPTGDMVLRATLVFASGDAEAQLRLICGDAADEVVPLVKAAPAGVIGPLIEDMIRHFGLDELTGEAPASSNS